MFRNGVILALLSIFLIGVTCPTDLDAKSNKVEKEIVLRMINISETAPDWQIIHKIKLIIVGKLGGETHTVVKLLKPKDLSIVSFELMENYTYREAVLEIRYRDELVQPKILKIKIDEIGSSFPNLIEYKYDADIVFSDAHKDYFARETIKIKAIKKEDVYQAMLLKPIERKGASHIARVTFINDEKVDFPIDIVSNGTQAKLDRNSEVLITLDVLIRQTHESLSNKIKLIQIGDLNSEEWLTHHYDGVSRKVTFPNIEAK